jgi:hypothetical protein
MEFDLQLILYLRGHNVHERAAVIFHLKKWSVTDAIIRQIKTYLIGGLKWKILKIMKKK